jgi:NitT/TauT family transport system ATP-binding protein
VRDYDSQEIETSTTRVISNNRFWPASQTKPPRAGGAIGRSAEVIAVKGLRKEYGTPRGTVVAVDEIDFKVAEGEFVAIVGPSGCGKSTLLKILAGLLPATRGEVKLRSICITGPRRDIGMVFQSPVLFPWRTVLENVLLPVDVQGLVRDSNRSRALDLLALFGLRGFEHRYPWELSGGMQQRVAITRALIHNPAMLLMDEPFGALDAMTRENLNLELQRLWLERRETVLFITHSIPEAVFLADRVLIMTPRPGRIVEQVPTFLQRPRGLEVMATPEFGSIVRRIRAHFNAKSGIDA